MRGHCLRGLREFALAQHHGCLLRIRDRMVALLSLAKARVAVTMRTLSKVLGVPAFVRSPLESSSASVVRYPDKPRPLLRQWRRPVNKACAPRVGVWQERGLSLSIHGHSGIPRPDAECRKYAVPYGRQCRDSVDHPGDLPWFKSGNATCET
jgi:hypothetical protein